MQDAGEWQVPVCDRLHSGPRYSAPLAAGTGVRYHQIGDRRIPGFDQAPDFIIPDEFTPVALIEAKLTEDDGTARDKVARVQRLRTLRDEQGRDYDVIACIAGRGRCAVRICAVCFRRRTARCSR